MTTDLLAIDCEKETERIVAMLRKVVHKECRRHGVVVGISGGIDSSVTVSLCVRAFGPEHVLGLLMPEKDSSPDSLELGRLIAGQLGIQTVEWDIAPTLEALGCYRIRDEAIRAVLPEYQSDWKFKIVLPGLLEQESLRFFSAVAEAPDGTTHKARLTVDAYLQLVAATNFKQRVRKMLEYYHSDLKNYTVAGTPNRLEYELGFFVKLGDGAADLKPIAHLYKTQVYRLAEYLGVPERIRSLPPTTDTYSLPQTQEEFYFSVSHGLMDLCLAAKEAGISAEGIAETAELTAEQVERIYRDIDAKRRVAAYLHQAPQTMESLPGPK